ncbi:MAG: hypothetical protein ACI85O_002143 [Saprospiraceae bacterium]|jgi:hypothetical protein
MKKNYILEVALTEAAIFLLLWLLNPYIGFMLTLFFVGISFFVLVISMIAELIERTRITRAYFWWMGISVIVPLVIAAFFVWVDGGSIEEWL